MAFLASSGASSHAWGAFPVEPNGEAFKNGMIGARWFSAIKQFVGTAYEAYDAKNGYSDASPTAPLSKVWFTGGQGVLSEIMWPTVDTPQVRDSQFLVSDGRTFFFEERRDSDTRVEWIAPGVPGFRVTNADRQGRFVIEKTILADPDRDVVFQHVRLTRKVPGLHLYLLHNPSVSNTPMGNSARVSVGETVRRGLPAGLYAWQGGSAQAVVFSVPLKQVSAGFEGASDGYQDLHQDFWMDYRFESATHGNVAMTAWLDLPEEAGVSEFDMTIGFGVDVLAAGASGRASLATGYRVLRDKFVKQWSAYQETVLDLSGPSRDGGQLFRASVAVLKSTEDKTHAGAFVASPTVPWGNHQEDYNADVYRSGSRAHQTGGYHMVWPRDLYQMATTFLAIQDSASAVASLNFLKAVQYGPNSGTWEFGPRKHSKDGSFPQNAWVNGEPYWAGLQMDETALPVVLAYRLWKSGRIAPKDYWNMVRRAADLIQEFGPWSPQERWEEAFGASPSNIASEIAALWCAAEFAEKMGDTERANRYRWTADAWSAKPGDNVETWTFTHTGGLGNGRYYTRIQGASAYDEIWDPNSERTINLANGAGRYRQKDLTDGGFLELVRFGVRPALDPAILESLPELDATIGVEVPGVGPGWRRYFHDRYNYDDETGRQTEGMPWPFLTGERGHYELQRAVESGIRREQLSAVVDPYVETMEKMATPTFMLPEQVWDVGPGAGKSTGAATPLGWTHGEYIKLLRSSRDGAIFDRLPLVVARSRLLGIPGFYRPD